MKIVYQSPEPVSELATEAVVAETRLREAIFFRPLSSPRLYGEISPPALSPRNRFGAKIIL